MSLRSGVESGEGQTARPEGDAAAKIKTVVVREFRTEIESKERALALIDDRLTSARKTFHRLRYAIVNSFYNSKKFELTDEDIQKEISSQRDPVAKTQVYSMLINEQKRLHPALKNVLGEKSDVTLDELPSLRPQRKRPKLDVTGTTSTSLNMTIPIDSEIFTLRPQNGIEPIDSSIDQALLQNSTVSKSNFSFETSEGDSSKSELKIPMYIEPKGVDSKVLKIDAVTRSKRKKKFRIIIGNTSKYIGPSSQGDLITHKWLLYIRGPPAYPDISHIIDSITVQLHDSYAPHNIVKLKSPPFHLSKRGWGEFPVKLKFHFKNGLFNKPVNLMHNLKLDRLRTGLQTLGGETVADIWLNTDESMIDKNGNSSDMTSELFDVNEKESRTPHLPDVPNLSNPHMNEIQIKKEIINLLEEKMIKDINCEGDLKSNAMNTTNGLTDNYFESVHIKEEPMDIDDEQIIYDNFKSCTMQIHNFGDDDNNTQYFTDSTNHKNYDESENNVKSLSNSFFECNNLLTPDSKDALNLPFLESKCSINSTAKYGQKIVLRKDKIDIRYSVQILKCLYEEHCYQKNVEILRNMNIANNFCNSCDSVDKRILIDFSKFDDFDKLLKWYKSLEMCDNAESVRNTLDVSKIVELNKVKIEKTSVMNNLSGICLSNLKKIVSINSIAIQQYMNELSIVFHGKRLETLDKIHKYINVLKNALTTNNLILTSNFSPDELKMIFGADVLSYESKRDFFCNMIKIINTIEGFYRDLPKIKDIRCVVNLMLKRLPIIEEVTNITEYNQFFPYAVNSSDAYFTLDLIKRRNVQWSRAKLINTFLKNYFPSNHRYKPLWSTKQILFFSQYHGYFPTRQMPYSSSISNYTADDAKEKVKLKEIFENAPEINTRTAFDVHAIEKTDRIKIEHDSSSTDVNKNGIFCDYVDDLCYISDSSDDEVDICELFDKNRSKNVAVKNCNAFHKTSDLEIMPFENEDERFQCHFIERKCSELGFELRNQNIGNGYAYGLVHKLILSAMKNFIEDMLRRSLSVKIEALKSVSNENITSEKNEMNTQLDDISYATPSTSQGCSNQISGNIQSDSAHIFHFKKEQSSLDHVPINNSMKSRNIDISGVKSNTSGVERIWNISESETSHEVSLRHIFEALKTRKEFDFITNYGLGLEESEYCGNL